jgi:hypothetical protein
LNTPVARATPSYTEPPASGNSCESTRLVTVRSAFGHHGMPRLLIFTCSSMKYVFPVSGLVHGFVGVSDVSTQIEGLFGYCTVAMLRLVVSRSGSFRLKFEMDTPLSSCMSCRIHFTEVPLLPNAPYS